MPGAEYSSGPDGRGSGVHQATSKDKAKLLDLTSVRILFYCPLFHMGCYGDRRGGFGGDWMSYEPWGIIVRVLHSDSGMDVGIAKLSWCPYCSKIC